MDTQQIIGLKKEQIRLEFEYLNILENTQNMKRYRDLSLLFLFLFFIAYMSECKTAILHKGTVNCLGKILPMIYPVMEEVKQLKKANGTNSKENESEYYMLNEYSEEMRDWTMEYRNTSFQKFLSIGYILGLISFGYVLTNFIKIRKMQKRLKEIKENLFKIKQEIVKLEYP